MNKSHKTKSDSEIFILETPTTTGSSSVASSEASVQIDFSKQTSEVRDGSTTHYPYPYFHHLIGMVVGGGGFFFHKIFNIVEYLYKKYLILSIFHLTYFYKRTKNCI